jgi:hypothetical protein
VEGASAVAGSAAAAGDLGVAGHPEAGKK